MKPLPWLSSDSLYVQSQEPSFCFSTLRPPSRFPASVPAGPTVWNVVDPSFTWLTPTHPSRLSSKPFSLWGLKTLWTKLVTPISVMILNFVHTCPVTGHSGLFICLFVYLLTYLWPCWMAYGILVPLPGIEPGPPAVEARSPNHWTAREVPGHCFIAQWDCAHVSVSSTRLQAP